MLTFDNSVTFAKDKEPDVSLRNFSDPEDGFIWSTGKWCEIVFSFEEKTKGSGSLLNNANSFAELIFDLDAFRVDEAYEGQNFSIFFNGLRVKSVYCKSRVTSIVSFNAKLLKPTDNNITIDTPDAVQPSKFGVGDNRILGVKLFSLQIRKAS
jgi:hypothetical protein